MFTSSITCLFALKNSRCCCCARDGKQGKETYQKVWRTCSRKRREKCWQASVVYCRFFNELVIEAGEPCKRSLQPRIDLKSVVITLVNPSNCFLTMFEGSERQGVGNTCKNYYKLSRFVEAHGRCYIHALSSMQPVFSTRFIQEIIHAELYG